MQNCIRYTHRNYTKNKTDILGALAKLRKATVDLDMRLSAIRMEQFGSHQTDFMKYDT